VSHQEPVIQLLSDLVAIPSMNPMGRSRVGKEYSEECIAEFVEQYLKHHSIDAKKHSVSAHRPNIIGYVDAGATATVMLEAHLDTVHGDNMTIAPFIPTIENGRLYGRGSCDTKASLAAFLHTAVTLAQKKTLRYNLVISAVSDEEYSFSGARYAVESGLKADIGIVGEPTQLHMVKAHKGVLRWRIVAKGVAAHSAYPDRGDNAIYTMGYIVTRLDEYAAELMKEPAHEILGTPTLSVGVIEGGQAVNIIPDHCVIEIDRRTLPAESEHDILQSARAALKEVPNWEFEPPHVSIQGMEVAEDNPFLVKLAGAIQDITGSTVIEVAQYATNAGVYSAYGIPSVVFGPGNIKQAHTAEEYVEISQVLDCCEIIKRFLTS
jgi:acetylornithine deacetylase/succinyl-diaminopimelate desuccinylase family protein